ncbi:MAG: hypothetical protein QGG71_22945 [Pirellulaceae bacterium]|jgi:hypothetical protein|nr:hypothetical protein [Pirellulaceae bacterium]
MWETHLANRRSFLSQLGTGHGSIALTHLLAEEGLLVADDWAKM